MFIDTSLECRVNYASRSFDLNENGVFYISKRTLIQIKKGNEYFTFREENEDLECLLEMFNVRNINDLVGKQVSPLYEDEEKRNLIGILPFIG